MAQPKRGQTFDVGSGPDILRHVCASAAGTTLTAGCGAEFAASDISKPVDYVGAPPKIAIPMCAECATKRGY